VLRGPQGTLFGRNTTAGIVKFDTIKPSQTSKGRATPRTAATARLHLRWRRRRPDRRRQAVAARVSALYQHRDDWSTTPSPASSADGTVSPKKNAMGGFDEKQRAPPAAGHADRKAL
jgi:iron complex outermembrane receptor protein